MAALALVLRIDAENPTLGDILLENGRCRLTSTLAEEVAQSLYTRFLFFKGEWFIDPNAGLPWYQQILGIKNSDANVSAILRQVITTCPGVASLGTFSLNRTGRHIAPRFTCKLIDGAVLRSEDYAEAFVIQVAA